MKREPGLTRRAFIASTTLATGLSACGMSIMPVTRPDPASFDACRSQPRLKVLTWNVFLMPSWVGESPNNGPRAAAMASTLLEHDFDILCLQKVFDVPAREILKKSLASRFPHSYGPANGSPCLLENSGVMVLSRQKLADYQEIEFSDCTSVECFSRKGALLVSGTCGNTPFRLIATHLQGEDGSTYTTLNQSVRDNQMQEIRERLITPHLEPKVPFIICGDFGTPRFSDACCGGETLSYRRMLATFGADEIPETLITLDEQSNELALSDTGRKNEVDYVFVRKNGLDLQVARERWIFRREGWDTTSHRTDLSYHYAVSAELRFGST